MREVNIENLNGVYDEMHKAFVNSFKGVPVRIDKKLKGNEYFIAVSRQLYKEIEKEQGKSRTNRR